MLNRSPEKELSVSGAGEQDYSVMQHGGKWVGGWGPASNAGGRVSSQGYHRPWKTRERVSDSQEVSMDVDVLDLAGGQIGQ